MNRTCTVCGKTYPATAEYFNRTKRTKLGLVAYCKACNADKLREWFRKNPHKAAEYNRKARESDPERVKGYGRAYRERKKAQQVQVTELERLLAEKDRRIAELEANADPELLTIAYGKGRADEQERSRQRIAELEAQLKAVTP